MHRTGIVRLAVATTAGSALLTACADAGGEENDKAGGDASTVTLTMGTGDVPGSPSADRIDAFAREVDELTDGAVEIDPLYPENGEIWPDWDQAVARRVMEGDLEMGLVPARAWDTEGVLTMRALHAPFLVASDALVAEIVTGELADEMLDGLEDVGVTGLALAPAGLRHLFVFGKVPKSLDDLAGDVVRAPTSDTTYATLEALGLKPDDLTTSYDAFTDGVEDGTVTAAESSFVLASGLPAPATAIGDVALYPRVDAIVVNSGVFDELTEEQQGALRQAAEATRDWAISTTPSETDAAADYCDRGLDIVTTDFDQRAMQRAVQPVYDELEEDPTTRSMIKVIETLKQDDPVSLTQIECDSVLPDDEDQSTPDDAAVLNGVYRFVVTEERMAARGYSQSEIDVESGINTVTMEDGSFTDEWRSPQGPRTCTASYTVTGQRVTFRWIQGCYGDWAATYTMDGDTVRWSDLEALPPYNSTEDQKATETYFAIPWTRID